MTTYRAGRRAVTHLDRTRRLRRDATDAERRLWRLLRSRRFAGFKFRRQHEFGPYILDFVCVAARLVIEADGGQHFLPRGVEDDRTRDQYLAARGYRTVRFSDREILLEPSTVEAELERQLAWAPHPNPLPEEGEGTPPIRAASISTSLKA